MCVCWGVARDVSGYSFHVKRNLAEIKKARLLEKTCVGEASVKRGVVGERWHKKTALCNQTVPCRGCTAHVGSQPSAGPRYQANSTAAVALHPSGPTRLWKAPESVLEALYPSSHMGMLHYGRAH